MTILSLQTIDEISILTYFLQSIIINSPHTYSQIGEILYKSLFLLLETFWKIIEVK